MRRAGSGRWWMLALWLLAGPLRAPAAPAPAPAPRPATLRLLFAESLFANVNRADTLAAFKLWVESIGLHRGFELDAQIESYGQLAELEQRIADRSTDLFVMTSWDYLSSTNRDALAAAFLPQKRADQIEDDLLLLARRSRGPTSLPGLRGCSLLLHRQGAHLGRRWIEAELRSHGLGRLDDFFTPVHEVTKASAAVLPVFFGQSDLGVVYRSSLETLVELNPQVENSLQVVAHSPSLPESVIALRRDFGALRDDVMGALTELHTEPRGQQLLLIFKVHQLVPFEWKHLEGVRDLQARLAAPPPAAPSIP